MNKNMNTYIYNILKNNNNRPSADFANSTSFTVTEPMVDCNITNLLCCDEGFLPVKEGVAFLGPTNSRVKFSIDSSSR